MCKEKLEIWDIEAPSEEEQMAAVQEDVFAIQYITNPSEAVQLAAVQEKGCTIQYITSPSEAVQLAAVQKDGYAIRYIKNPSKSGRLDFLAGSDNLDNLKFSHVKKVFGLSFLIAL